MITGAATIFTVSDVEASVRYYADALGLAVTFRYGEPLSYACLCRDDFALHLAAPALTKNAPGQGAAAVFVRDVDAIHAEFTSKHAIVQNAPQDRDYGMRDFSLVDPDGNRLTFGQGVEK